MFKYIFKKKTTNSKSKFKFKVTIKEILMLCLVIFAIIKEFLN